MTEYRVWHEAGDLILVTESYSDALAELTEQEIFCPCGEVSCGVLSSHGYHIQVVENGMDVTGNI